MKFYDFPTAPSPRRVRIFAAEKGIPLDTVQIDLREGEQFSDAFRKINPHCTVPALVLDDGTVLCDTLAIMSYLEDIKDEPKLMGSTPLERAQILALHNEMTANGYVPASEVFRNSVPRYKTRALVGPDDYDQIPALVDRGKLRLKNFFRDLNEILEGKDFVAGDHITLADITAVIAVDFAERIELAPGPEYANLIRWYEMMKARPSYQA